jgi:hypothetical protein
MIFSFGLILVLRQYHYIIPYPSGQCGWGIITPIFWGIITPTKLSQYFRDDNAVGND